MVVVGDAGALGETFVTVPEAGPSDEITIDGAVSMDVAGRSDGVIGDGGPIGNDGSAGLDLAADRPAGPLPIGQPCQTNGSCSSNFCVDGVC
ncbi:MAG TPA: hypothetical protein VNO55_30985 [Polyangia bacterium]|nr:hypothetical protein [Polyangia bacterium]